MENKKTNIEIFSLAALSGLVTAQGTDYSIVSIRNSDLTESSYAVFGKYRRNFRNIHVAVFDDIEYPQDGLAIVEPEQIKLILAWARNRRNIAVHCTAGISRSSAVAYLIACTRMPPSEAIGLLDPDRHCPNDLVIYHGIKILNDISIYEEYMKWIMRAAISNDWILTI